MEEPVTTQSGYSYDKQNINSHIIKNGNIDPVTKFNFILF